MTIECWMIFAITFICGIGLGICILIEYSYEFSAFGKSMCIAIPVIVSLILLGGMLWYFQNTASGQRALTDQKSNLKNGLERTITVYTADGRTIAKYSGKIDIKASDGGYMLFDYEGKRYTYYNCFIESIADID